MIAVDFAEWQRNTFCTSYRFVSDTDFRLQLTAVFQLLRGSAQSPGDCSYIIASSGTLHFLFYPIISGAPLTLRMIREADIERSEIFIVFYAY